MCRIRSEIFGWQAEHIHPLHGLCRSSDPPAGNPCISVFDDRGMIIGKNAAVEIRSVNSCCLGKTTRILEIFSYSIRLRT
jgi:hypothetical protein